MTSTPQFLRKCTVTLAGRVIEGPPVTIGFTTTFKTRGAPAQTVLRISNAAEETIAVAQKIRGVNPGITVIAGYENDQGLAVAGEVHGMEIDSRPPEQTLILKIGDASARWATVQVQKTFSKGVNTSFIVRALALDAGFPVDNIEPGREIVSTRAGSYSGRFATVMQGIAARSDSEFYFRAGRLVFQPKLARGRVEVVFLSNETGLISLQPRDKGKPGFKFKSYFQHRFGPGVPVQIEDDKFTGILKIDRGKNVFHTIGSAFSEFEAVPIT